MVDLSPSVLIFATGGTIGMEATPAGLAPAPGLLPQEARLLRALARQSYSGAVGLITTALRLWALDS